MKLGELAASVPAVAAEIESCLLCSGSGKRGKLTLGPVLRKMREDAGISLERMARVLQMSKGALSEMERASPGEIKRHPSLLFIEAWITICRKEGRK